jgi:hypothetical protein
MSTHERIPKDSPCKNCGCHSFVYPIKGTNGCTACIPCLACGLSSRESNFSICENERVHYAVKQNPDGTYIRSDYCDPKIIHKKYIGTPLFVQIINSMTFGQWTTYVNNFNKNCPNGSRMPEPSWTDYCLR